MTSLPRRCEVCGGPLHSSNLVGICSTSKECKRVKMERTRHPDGKPSVNTEPPCAPNGESWKPAPAPYGSLYLVSNRGRVWSSHGHGRILKAATHGPRGAKYPMVALCNGSSIWRVRVHQLVMLAFAGPCPEGLEIRHLDGDPSRNWWPENLAYGTHKENGEDVARHGTGKAGAPRGSNHLRAKLTEDLVRQIRSEYALGGVTERALATRHGVNVGTVHRLLVRDTWSHVA